MLPLSKAVLAVIGLFYAVAYWNAFFSALLYLNDSKHVAVAAGAAHLRRSTTPSSAARSSAPNALPPQASIQMAILVVSIVPILLRLPVPAAALRQGRADRRRQGLIATA